MTVWTPKRILMMIAGFILFLAGYAVYAHFLGGIDGLPPLPPHFLPGPSTSADFPVEGNIARKFTQAFGKDCPEKDWPIKLDLQRKRWIMASMDLKFLKDGRVRLTPFSAAYFPKRAAGAFPEISTVQCEEAFLTLDRPVQSLTEMSHRKVMSVELRGKPGITIINNRKTEKKNDDIELQITKGPLFFEDHRNMIWTEGMVQLLDTQTQPHPTRIRAEGMELFLTNKVEQNKLPAAGSSGAPVGGIEKLVLLRHVEMHLYVDSGSGFLGGPPKLDPTNVVEKQEKTPEKSHVIIRTRGSFTYLVPKDKAWFNSPEINDTVVLTPVQQVHVLREHKNGVVDQLLCSQLKLQFRAKNNDPKPDGKPLRSVNKQIETAHATSRKEHEIVLTMDSENLEAYGNELFYRSPSATEPSMTVLKGKPMRAVKQGHKLQAVELHLFGNTTKGNDQKAVAFGPGKIDLFDKSNKKNPYPMHALWKDKLISSKDLQGEKWMDLLTLVGDASFRDDEHDKELYGHRLLVWLEPTTAIASSTKSDMRTSASPSAPRHRPFKLEAFGSVMARSPKLLIPKADYLKVLFKDQIAAGEALPVANPGKGNPKNPNHTAMSPGEDKSEPKTATLEPPPDKKEIVRPLVLIARQIVTYVTRIGSKNELQEVVTEGKVHVHQEAERGKDNGVDIKGEMLHLVHHPEGDTLYVFGDSREPAMLHLGKMEILGPKITVNQRENIAHVAGSGALKMPSNTTFDGKKTEDKNAFMRIHWNESMWFYGSLKSADFYGGVQAFQDNASMKCKTLQVTLDRVVSFKDGQEKKESAKVDQFVCDREVLLVDEKRDQNKNRVHLNRLEAAVLTVDNEQKLANATGPGRVFLLHKGKGDPLLGDPKKKSGRKEQMYLTRVEFFARMYSIPGHNSRTYKFYDNVRVYHVPSKKPFIAINPNKLPDGGFYLRSNLLTVLRRDLPNGQKSQEMQAEGNVSFNTNKFFGRADVVKYDERNQQVIFQGKPGEPATLYEYQKGLRSKLIKGMKILYDRKTGKFLLDHSPLIQTRFENRPGESLLMQANMLFRRTPNSTEMSRARSKWFEIR